MPDGNWIDAPLHRIARADVAVPVRFGGEQSRTHRMILRFGEVYGEHLAASVLAECGSRALVAREAIAWDPVTRTFVAVDQEALVEITHTLDPTAAVCAGVGGMAKGALEFCFALLGEVFAASPIIFGGIGTLLVWWFAKAVLLWFLWHWLVWFVAIPSVLVFGVCDAIAEHRVLRLRQALLGAATDSLAAAA